MKRPKTLEESFSDEFRAIDAITEENKIIKVALKNSVKIKSAIVK